MKSSIKIFFCLLIIVLYACKENPVRSNNNIDTSKIIFGKSMEGIEIGNDSITVIQKLGKPSAIGIGDFKGYILEYTEGRLNYMSIIISNDNLLGLGVINVNVESPYQGKSKDSIGIDSDRNFVINRIGIPDTTYEEAPFIYDIYYYEKNSFHVTYKNYRVYRISMNKPRH